MNKVLIDNIINLFFIIVISLRSQNAKKKYLNKRTRRDSKCYDDKENFNKEINLQDDEHDDNIDLDGIDWAR